MRVRRICCLNDLGMIPLLSSEAVTELNDASFPRQHNSPKRKGGSEGVTGRKARGLQVSDTFYVSQAAAVNKLQVLDFYPFSTQI